MTIKTIIEVATRGDEMTQPGGIALRFCPERSEFIVHYFNTGREPLSMKREYFQGSYCHSFAEGFDELNRRVQRASGYDTGGSIDVEETLRGVATRFYGDHDGLKLSEIDA